MIVVATASYSWGQTDATLQMLSTGGGLVASWWRWYHLEEAVGTGHGADLRGRRGSSSGPFPLVQSMFPDIPIVLQQWR